MTELICMLRTPQDGRFSASGMVTLQYISIAETEKIALSDAKDIVRNGQLAIDNMLSEGIISGKIPDQCYIPEGFPVVVNTGGRTVTVRP